MAGPERQRQPPFTLLLLCILAIFFVEPFVADRVGGSLLIRLSVVGLTVPILASGLLGAKGAGRWFLLALAVGVALLNGGVIARQALPAGIGVVAALVFLLWTTARVFRHVVAAPVFSANLVSGALASYLMLAVAWALAYGLVEVTWPGSFGVPPGPGGVASVDVPTLMYFSAITIMTIGYGDVTPVAPIARALAVVEGLAGIVFTAVVLGALVGTLIGKRREHA